MSDTNAVNLTPSQPKPPTRTENAHSQVWLEESEGGEMGARIRAFDWSTTTLGALSDWPESLRISLRLCLNSRFAMCVRWGPELLNLYNDAYVSILGRRHPKALGLPMKSVWPEIWSKVAPQVAAVMERGETVGGERSHSTVTRNGFLEDAWFTWSYTAIRGGGGDVLGLYGIFIEDTARVLAEKSRQRLSDEQVGQTADIRARTILESITEAFFSLDAHWRFTYLNPQSFVLLGRPLST